MFIKQYTDVFELFETNPFSFLRNEIPMNTWLVPESGNFVQILFVANDHYVTIHSLLEIKTDQNDKTNYIDCTSANEQHRACA